MQIQKQERKPRPQGCLQQGGQNSPAPKGPPHRAPCQRQRRARGHVRPLLSPPWTEVVWSPFLRRPPPPCGIAAGGRAEPHGKQSCPLQTPPEPSTARPGPQREEPFPRRLRLGCRSPLPPLTSLCLFSSPRGRRLPPHPPPLQPSLLAAAATKRPRVQKSRDRTPIQKRNTLLPSVLPRSLSVYFGPPQCADQPLSNAPACHPPPPCSQQRGSAESGCQRRPSHFPLDLSAQHHQGLEICYCLLYRFVLSPFLLTLQPETTPLVQLPQGKHPVSSDAKFSRVSCSGFNFRCLAVLCSRFLHALAAAWRRLWNGRCYQLPLQSCSCGFSSSSPTSVIGAGALPCILAFPRPGRTRLCSLAAPPPLRQPSPRLSGFPEVFHCCWNSSRVTVLCLYHPEAF